MGNLTGEFQREQAVMSATVPGAAGPRSVMVPSVTEREGSIERTMDPFSWLLLKDRTIMIQDQISDALAAVVVAQILYLDNLPEKKDIKIYINSPGGSVTAGMAIFDAMRNVKSDVRTIGMGMCASMGSFLLSAGTPGKRSVLPNTKVMIHRPSWGVNGNEQEIRNTGWSLTEDRLRFENYYAAFAGGMTDAEFKAFHDTMDGDSYLNATEAVRCGLVDKILVPGGVGSDNKPPEWKVNEIKMMVEFDNQHFDNIDVNSPHTPDNLKHLKKYVELREERLGQKTAQEMIAVPAANENTPQAANQNATPVVHGRPDQRAPQPGPA